MSHHFKMSVCLLNPVELRKAKIIIAIIAIGLKDLFCMMVYMIICDLWFKLQMTIFNATYNLALNLTEKC